MTIIMEFLILNQIFSPMKRPQRPLFPFWMGEFQIRQMKGNILVYVRKPMRTVQVIINIHQRAFNFNITNL